MIIFLGIHLVDGRVQKPLGADVLKVELPARKHDPRFLEIDQIVLFHRSEAGFLDLVRVPA